MTLSTKMPIKLDSLNNETFKALREKTLNLRKDKVYVHLSGENLNISTIEKTCPLTFLMLKHKYKIDTQNIQIKVVNGKKSRDDTEYVITDTSPNECIHKGHGKAFNDGVGNNTEGKNNSNEKIITNARNAEIGHRGEGGTNFMDSFIQFNIPVLNEFERFYFYKHIIEIIDTLAADVVYKHSMGGYKKNDKYNFVTVLFNNLKIYEKNKIHHEFCFSLHEQKPLTINCYIVYSGNTSYILKLDFFQENNLVFDIYTTFVNINSVTFKPQEVIHVNNSHNNERYKEVSIFASHLKEVQNLFNHKDMKNMLLRQEDINFMLEYFKNSKVEKKNFQKNVYQNVDIFDYDHVQAKLTNSEKGQVVEASQQSSAVLSTPLASQKNTIPIIGHILNTNNLAFYTGKNIFYCKDSYIESKNFISSEFKNIHNFTFGGHLAYMSFCHAMTIIKHFVSHPVLIEINEIQYILPVPYNSVVSFRGKVVYCDADKIQVKIAAYCFDLKKNTHYLTTIFDISFKNNSEISFIPLSEEEIKLYLLGYIRSQLLP
ncbi:hypothetical protein, conserved [Plasmodium gonderi]|uniref:HotDog ACOT-type domain-containing protein n=1 Tax=Plasmodium gonderi TaxID=77519 RepID=A0A1Y1JA92_PLAGO|nr:hypothetical protein, conserved [Plasmodium gonderi]GAW79431.1 hypothetical protein, conserved [Plasmodium gonderi]